MTSQRRSARIDQSDVKRRRVALALASPGFWLGAARAFDAGALLRTPRSSAWPYRYQSVAEAIGMDWAMVGGDLEQSLSRAAQLTGR